ncbi:hypothetical protein [Mesorhizobium sp. YM1C-6-2]|uniref:hypothetical protein n=1 Tax=Mesorhizobium sp. YM1C-6-2 TaxID=1827501 RepID=UPI00160071F2|nr:hypothetical protein [Mesorhizobium sp. YM1C-6-2]
MQAEHREYATTDLKGRRRPTLRLVKLPGEKRHVERSESAIYFARKLQIDKRERRIRNG